MSSAHRSRRDREGEGVLIMFLLLPPGVYRPQPDTWLVARAAGLSSVGPGSRVLDLCTGSGVLALLAARAGAGRVSAVDVSRTAVWTARANAVLHRQRRRMRVLRGDGFGPIAGERFDLIVANPPYVISDDPASDRGRHRAWAGGPDGRHVIDEVCRRAAAALAPGGSLFMVQSTLGGTAESLRLLRRAGLTAVVSDRMRAPFGPVMRARRDALRARGLIGPTQTAEELVVIRADRPRTRRA
jgi:release factor glutamine methyltransferase